MIDLFDYRYSLKYGKYDLVNVAQCGSPLYKRYGICKCVKKRIDVVTLNGVKQIIVCREHFNDLVSDLLFDKKSLFYHKYNEALKEVTLKLMETNIDYFVYPEETLYQMNPYNMLPHEKVGNVILRQDGVCVYEKGQILIEVNYYKHSFVYVDGLQFLKWFVENEKQIDYEYSYYELSYSVMFGMLFIMDKISIYNKPVQEAYKIYRNFKLSNTKIEDLCEFLSIYIKIRRRAGINKLKINK